MKKISRLLTITACGAALGAPLQALPSTRALRVTRPDWPATA